MIGVFASFKDGTTLVLTLCPAWVDGKCACADPSARHRVERIADGPDDLTAWDAWARDKATEALQSAADQAEPAPDASAPVAVPGLVGMTIDPTEEIAARSAVSPAPVTEPPTMEPAQ